MVLEIPGKGVCQVRPNKSICVQHFLSGDEEEKDSEAVRLLCQMDYGARVTGNISCGFLRQTL